MTILKRTKSEKTHYAAAVDAAGNVTQWDADQSRACPMDEVTAEKVNTVYKDRPNAGKFELVKGDGKKGEVRAPDTSAEVKLLKAENAALEKHLGAAKKDLQASHEARVDVEQSLTAAAAKLADAVAERDLLKEENERLKKKTEPEKIVPPSHSKSK
jgi:hypothetical protein